ncbi:239_t:CDS:2, partial [Acaulospora colombiana]
MPSGTRNTLNDSDKENMMDLNQHDQIEEGDTSGYSGAKTYDSDQDKDEKRWLRREYRTLIIETEEKRQDYLRPESNGLVKNIEKANELVQKVKHTYEAALDSRLLVKTSDLGVQKARLMKLDNNVFDADDYISKLITLMGGRQLDNEDERPSLNWKTVGEIASHCTLRVPTLDFMLGPLSVEQKGRKTGVRQTLVKDKNEMIVPKQVIPSIPNFFRAN